MCNRLTVKRTTTIRSKKKMKKEKTEKKIKKKRRDGSVLVISSSTSYSNAHYTKKSICFTLELSLVREREKESKTRELLRS